VLSQEAKHNPRGFKIPNNGVEKICQ